MELITGENDKGRRLDRILRKALPSAPLPLIHRLLRQGQVLVNGKPAKAQDRLDSGKIISLPIAADAAKRDHKVVLPPPNVLWEGRGLIAVNKPAGVASHGRDSLDTMVRSFLADKLPPSLSFRPGPAHRLDKPSSGVVIFSTSIDGARLFSSLTRERKARKTYLAIVEGIVEKEETWEDFLLRDREKKKTFICQRDTDKSKDAITMVKPLAASGGFSLIMAEIVTGRTHQIRAQAASRGHPLAGDRKYGSVEDGEFFLHAWKMEFLDISIEAPIPAQFRKKIKTLFSL